jgi:hypothetical protein
MRRRILELGESEDEEERLLNKKLFNIEKVNEILPPLLECGG